MWTPSSRASEARPGTHNHRKECGARAGNSESSPNASPWLWVPDRRALKARLSGTTAEALPSPISYDYVNLAAYVISQASHPRNLTLRWLFSSVNW